MNPVAGTRLRAMDEAAFAAYLRTIQAEYATDSVAAGRWPHGQARALAQSEATHTLPQGLHTPGHRFWEIVDAASGSAVGSMWFAVQGEGAQRRGYLYNIRIEPAARGRGHARAAMRLLEQLALDEGLSHVALHVFAFNSGAQALYRSLGFGITGFNMVKALRGDAP